MAQKRQTKAGKAPAAAAAPAVAAAPRRRRWARAVRALLTELRQLQFPQGFRIPAPGEAAELLPPQAMPSLPGAADPKRWIADLATCLSRLERKLLPDGGDEPPDELRPLYRHFEAALDALGSGGVEIRDHTGERYVPGMALRVIAFQPQPGTRIETIVETLKPSVFLGDQLIQRGEVIVATPPHEPEEVPADAEEGAAEPEEATPAPGAEPGAAPADDEVGDTGEGGATSDGGEAEPTAETVDEAEPPEAR